MNGYIKLHRKLLDWEWYDDPATKVVFIHLLLKAGIKDDEWHGIPISRGSCIASYDSLAKALGLTNRQVRTAIAHLETTGEVTRCKHGKTTVFSINNYNNYQRAAGTSPGKRQDGAKIATDKRQGSDNSIRNKEYKEDKEEEKREENTLLTAAEKQLLINDYGKEIASLYERKLAYYIDEKRHGKHYQNNAATIRKWIEEDKASGKCPDKLKSYDIDELEQFVKGYVPHLSSGKGGDDK